MSYYAQIVDNTLVKVLSTNDGTIAENIDSFNLEYGNQWFQADFVNYSYIIENTTDSWENVNGIIKLRKYYSWLEDEDLITPPVAHASTGVYQWHEESEESGFWESL